MHDTLNAWFDRVPRMTVVVGHRTLPAFRSIGVLGYHVALVAALLTAIRTDLSLIVTVGLSAVAALSFFGWALLRRAVSGAELLVLLEHVWVAIAVVAAYLWLADAPLLAGLDVLTVGLAPFLAFGRIGCFTVGCCHGTPTPTGIRYGPAHDNLPPWLINRRLRPVPLFEAAGLFAIFVVGNLLIGQRAGTATVWFLASYAVLRFGTEALRGDERPRIGPVSVARLMSAVQLGAAVWLSDRVVAGNTTTGAVDPQVDSEALVVRLSPIAAVVVAGILLTAARARDRDPLIGRPHLEECWRRISGAVAAGGSGTSPVLATTSLGVDIGVSIVGPDTVHVSFRHPDHDTTGLALMLAGEPVELRNGICHATILTATPGPAAPSPAVEDAPAPTHVRATTNGSAEDYFTVSAGDPRRH